MRNLMSKPVCPKCSSEYVKRTTRVGFEHLISVFYVYPFRCKACRHRFRSMQWRIEYTRIELDRIAESKGRVKAVTEEIEDAHVV